MGNLLGAPVTEKDTHIGVTSSGAEYGVSTMQGWRVHMEDAHITETLIYAAEPNEGNNYSVIDLPGHSLFAVFDGHGGTFAAIYAGKNFCRVLSRQQKFIDYAKFELERSTKEEQITSSFELEEYLYKGKTLLNDALSDAFVELDKEIYCALHNQKVPDADKSYQQLRSESKGENCQSTSLPYANSTKGNDQTNAGTTACVVLITPKWIVCANAGDSRAVISREGNLVVPLSIDHKPDDEVEDRRIRTAGGFVAGGRVEGDLAVSRGFGDFRFKNLVVVMSKPFSGFSNSKGTEQSHPTMEHGDQKVSPIPEITYHERDALHDEFIIIACDGIWDVQSNIEAVKTVAELFQEGESNLGLICEEVRFESYQVLRLLFFTFYIICTHGLILLCQIFSMHSFVILVSPWVAKIT
jgi:serine/threonine protein phosphatase PrpC